MDIKIKPDDKLSFFLTPEQGEEVREAILQQIDTSFRVYVRETVGMHYPNVHNFLTGQRRISIQNFLKLLSGTRIELGECTLHIILENLGGGIVKTVDLPTIEETLSSLEGSELDPLLPNSQMEPESSQTQKEESRQPTSHAQEQSSPSSSSGKHLEELKTALGSRSWEQAEKSSDKSSNKSDSQQN